MATGGTGRSINKLSDAKIRALISAGDTGKYFDGGGLCLEILPSGSGSWRFKYRIDGKEDRMVFGLYPDVSLARARELHREARALKAQGINPKIQQRLDRAAQTVRQGETFDKVASRWLSQMKHGWVGQHYRNSARAIERDVYPTLAKLPVASITPAIVAATIAAIQARSVGTAARVRRNLHAIFDMALVEGLVQTNPVIMPRRGAVKLAKRKQPAILDVTQLGEILRQVESAAISPSMRVATVALSRTALRVGELVPARWDEIDLDTAVWTVPRDRMKMKDREDAHLVPLAPGLVETLRNWRRVCPSKVYVFPSDAGERGYITEAGLERVHRVTLKLRNVHVPHGWRSAFSTNAKDATDKNGARLWPDDAVEMSLDHVHGSKVATAYDRGKRRDTRVALMSWWDDLLSRATHGAEIIPFPNTISCG